MNRNSLLLLTAAATVIGCSSLDLFTKISQDIILDGLRYCSLGPYDLFLGPMLLFTSAVLAGFMASLVVVRQNRLPHIAMALYVLGKIMFFVSCDTFSAPFWFSLGLNGCLFLGIWLGNYTAHKFPLAPM